MLVSDLYCPSCRNAKDHKPQDNEVCWSCVAMGGAGNYKESKTNYDLIIRKSPEELAWELARICRMPFYKDDSEIDEYEVDCWAKWLKLEATDGATDSMGRPRR